MIPFTDSVISLPVAVLNKQSFKHQASLFWYAHQEVYGAAARDRALVLWVERNLESEPTPENLDWLYEIGAPAGTCKPCFEVFGCASLGINVPLNIQAALAQVIDEFDPEQLLEVIDCDMFHLQAMPKMEVADNEIWADSVYEDWHLHSLGSRREVIEPYFLNGGGYYNGGFVPLIAKARTFKRLLNSWVKIHMDINKQEWPEKYKWWAGMYALQAACENEQITMRHLEGAYIPGKNQLNANHYIAHYSVDKIFNKKQPGWPQSVNVTDFPDNIYYQRIARWLKTLQADGPAKTTLEDTWRHWIAKNLMMDNSPENIVASLEAKGYARDVIEKEIDAAASSPYFKGAKEVFRREIGKLENDDFEKSKSRNNHMWLLSTYEKLARLDDNHGEIERIPAPPFAEFVKHYVSKNRPVILEGAMESWLPYKKWNLDYLREIHGDATVSIQDGRESDPHFERNQKFHRKDVKFSEFLDRLENTSSSNDFYMTAGNMHYHPDALPKLFADCESIDIADGYLANPDGSLWIGPKGTITPLHFDMINNLFCQVRGRKRVRMVPSWSMPWVYNDYHVYSDVDVASPDFQKYPLFKNATVFDFVVEPGEILFIPIGWWHHLESLDITISLTRKGLRTKSVGAFGTGFIQESRNFQLGQH